MKITKNRLKKIIAEEISRFEEAEKPNPWAICTDSVGREDKEKYERCVKDVKVQHNLKEGATNEEWEMVDAMVQAMGHENALEAVIRALPSDTVKDVVKYVARMHEFDITPEEEKEYDAWTDVTDFFDKGEEEDLDENKGEDK